MKIRYNSPVRNSLQVAVLAALAIGLESNGNAAINLVNFDDWTETTLPPTGPSMEWGASGTSAFFQPGSVPPVDEILTGYLPTTPGDTYEISFSAQNYGPYLLGPLIMSFGNFSAACDLSVGQSYGPDGRVFVQENYDLLVTATEPITTMIFQDEPDIGEGVGLWDVSVTAVPEPASGIWFGFGACALVLAQKGLKFHSVKV